MNSHCTNYDLLSVFLSSMERAVVVKDPELARAYLCAILAHGDKKDKEGEVYFLHPVRVSERFDSKDEVIVALLHDVLEDSFITAENLREFGFSNTVVDAVIALTRNKLQSYSKYLRQVASNKIAKVVKIADIEDNLNPLRLQELDTPTRYRLQKKYENALTILRHL